MRRLWLIVTIPVTLAIVVFAIANRQEIDMNLWPFSVAVRLPLFLLALGTFGVGLLAGAFLVWLPALRWRRRAGVTQRKLDELTEDIERREVERREAERSRVAATQALTTVP